MDSALNLVVLFIFDSLVKSLFFRFVVNFRDESKGVLNLKNSS
jgi:hypothetical protein